MATKKTAAAVPQIVGATYKAGEDTRTLVLTHVDAKGKARFGVVAGSGAGASFTKLGWNRIVADGLRIVAMPDGSKPEKR